MPRAATRTPELSWTSPRGAAALLALLLCACPPSGGEKKAPPAASAPCAKVGDSCEFSPGKLGSCVQRDDCASSAPCFVCQSQH